MAEHKSEIYREDKQQPEPIYKEVIVRSDILPSPRPGKSLADLSSDKPFYTIRLWLEERAGLPRLFDWLMALSSIILGLSMYLYTSQMDSLAIGQFSEWFLPIRVTLIISGFGLILSDMIQEEFAVYRNISTLFRGILFITYSGLALMQFQSRDYDGFLMYGLFSIVILLETILNIMSSTAYMLYIQSFVIGTALIFRYLPWDSGLSSLSKGIYSLIDGSSWILNLVVIMILFTTVFGYFLEKKVLKVSLFISGVIMVALSVYYANIGYWSAAFFLLVTGIIGLLLPFWERMKVISQTDRTVVYKLFGTVVIAFSVVVAVISIVQQILLDNAKINLAEKADYGRITVDTTTNNAIQTLSGLSQNELFFSALVAKKSADLLSFEKAVFKNETDLSSVVALDKTGKTLSVYPFSTEIEQTNFANTNYFGATVFNKNNYLSRTAEEFTENIDKSVIAAVPVFDGNNETVGAVVASLNTNSLSDKLQEIMVDPLGQYISVVDSDGRWLVNPDQEKVGNLVDESDETYLLYSRGKSNGQGYDANGRYALFVGEKSKISNWSVIVSQPITTIMNVGKSGFVVILFMLLVTVITTVFSFIFSKNRDYGV